MYSKGEPVFQRRFEGALTQFQSIFAGCSLCFITNLEIINKGFSKMALNLAISMSKLLFCEVHETHRRYQVNIYQQICLPYCSKTRFDIGCVS